MNGTVAPPSSSSTAARTCAGLAAISSAMVLAMTAAMLAAERTGAARPAGESEDITTVLGIGTSCGGQRRSIVTGCAACVQAGVGAGDVSGEARSIGCYHLLFNKIGLIFIIVIMPSLLAMGISRCIFLGAGLNQMLAISSKSLMSFLAKFSRRSSLVSS